MYEEYERNGLKVTIHYDENPESPREWDNLGTMICSHRNYNLGDEQFDSDDFEGWEDLEKHLREDRDACLVLPLYLYDHSGIKMYTKGETTIMHHQAWDSGQVGFIFMTRETYDENYGDEAMADQEEANIKAIKALESEVKTYSQYIEGNVYGFTVEHPEEGEVDGCWGYFDLGQVREDANDGADNYVAPRQSKYAKKASALHG